MIPLCSSSPGYSPVLRHGTLVTDTSQNLSAARGRCDAECPHPQRDQTRQRQWDQHHFPHNTVILGACSVLRTSKILMMLLIRHYKFSEGSFCKAEIQFRSFTGSRLADDHWDRTLQLMKALLVYGSLHQPRNRVYVFQAFWRLHVPFLSFTEYFCFYSHLILALKILNSSCL